MKVSVIVPVLNEREHIRGLLDALFAQTAPPDEVVVADGGSTDGTKEILAEIAAAEPRLVVVNGPGSIGGNRNAAIAAARGDFIACTDAGCMPEPDWLEKLMAPMAEGAEWVAGFYRPKGKTLASTVAGLMLMPTAAEVKTESFNPGGSSQAFLKSAWDRVGGYPTAMSAAEDTLFAERLRAAGYTPVFVPEAVVAWDPPSGLGPMLVKAFRWGRADGDNRLRSGTYLKVTALYWGLLTVAALFRSALAGFALLGVAVWRTRFKYRWVSGAGKYLLIPVAHLSQHLAQSLGWLTGLGPRGLIEVSRRRLRRLKPKVRRPIVPMRTDRLTGNGSVVVLAAVPLHDVGGGSRGSQIAQELASRGYHVAYVYRYDSGESIDLGLRFDHPLLEEYRFDAFDVRGFLARAGIEPKLVICEFPHRDHLAPLEALRGNGYRVVYDLIDDWTDPALGWWYRPQVETEIIGLADALTASAPVLVEKLAGRTRRVVVEVANAVNTRIFDGRSLPPPSDLPAGEGPVFEYHGSLYGNWFDWAALASVAEAFPEARVVIIGDEQKHPVMPGNVAFLGLKPQIELPAYLANTDVGIIPFVVSDTTHAVSPLKVFEYLAMGVPVAATPMRPLLGLHGVHTNNDLTVAVRAALTGPRPDSAKARSAHSWGERLHRMFGGLDLELAPEQDPPVMVER